MKAERKKYSEEFKHEAVQMVECGMSQSKVAADLGLRANMLSRWVREYHERGGESGLSPSEREELKALRKENLELRMQRDILKKATAFFVKESK